MKRQHRGYWTRCGGFRGGFGVSAEESGGWDYGGVEEFLGAGVCWGGVGEARRVEGGSARLMGSTVGGGFAAGLQVWRAGWVGKLLLVDGIAWLGECAFVV